MSHIKQSVIWFQTNRFEQYQCATDISTEFRKGLTNIVAVNAPVKSGKRTIKEIFSLLNSSSFEKHLYISSFNRTDEQVQLDELEVYGFEIFKTNNKNITAALADKIAELCKTYSTIYLHFNESDYGTGSKQSLGSEFPNLLKNPKVRIIAYSATNEELCLSGLTPAPAVVDFNVPSSYRGAIEYINQGLVEDADPFWINSTSQLSQQATDAINILVQGSKTFGIVRFSAKEDKPKHWKDFEDAVTNLGVTHILQVDSNQGMNFNWGPDKLNGSWYNYVSMNQNNGTNYKVLIVLKQTCTRSTEVGFHEHIAFWHDRRTDLAAYNTALQAFGRVFHYLPPGSAEHKIKLYAKHEVLELAAGIISLTSYPHSLSSRITTTVHKANVNYAYEYFDHEPTNQEIIDANARYGAIRNGKIFRLNCSKNTTYDQARDWLDLANHRPHSHRMDHDNILYLDGPNQKHLASWNKYAVPHLKSKGAYCLMIILPNSVPVGSVVGTTHVTNKKSMLATTTVV